MTSLLAASAADEPLRRSIDDDARPELVAPTLEYTYLAFSPTVLGYFRSHGMGSAEDLVGEVFLSVARGLGRFHGDHDALRRWVFTIARRRRVDEIRRRVLRPQVVMRELPEQSVDDRVEGIDADLVAALHALTSLQRDVVVLRFVADLPIDDVARILRRSTGAVKALQVRALTQLSARVERPRC